MGGSQYLIDGKIKLKSGAQLKEFTETGLKFEDGSEMNVDVVVFATGYVSASSSPLSRLLMAQIIGSETRGDMLMRL